MPCYSPLRAFRSPKLSAAGKLSIAFTPSKGFADLPIQLPCGQCIGCRLERSRQWAVRCLHESQLHDENAFLTLTYSDENLPSDGSISKREMQLFIKRLRKLISPRKIRYVYCGEYGDKTKRPHYHALIFNYDFSADRRVHSRNRDGSYLYTSAELESVWPKGHALIGDVTFESAAYVARYCLKKVTGKAAAAAYERLDPLTGEVFTIEPEFFQMSLRPGIGRGWIDKYKSDVYPSDEVIVRGHKTRPPRYYDSLLPENEVSPVKKKRLRKARKHKSNNTPERLKVREMIHNARVNEKLPRKI